MKEPGEIPLGEALVDIRDFNFWGNLWLAGNGPYSVDDLCYVAQADEIAPDPYDRSYRMSLASLIIDDFNSIVRGDKAFHVFIFNRNCEEGGFLYKEAVKVMKKKGV